MPRGDFNFLADLPAYTDAAKTWYVNIDRSDLIWYELLVGELPSMLEGDPVRGHLKALAEHVSSTLEKRFIYFVVTRTKLRFVPGSLRWRPLRRAFRILMLEGANSKPVPVEFPWHERVWPWSRKPRIDFDTRLMTFWDGPRSATWSVHDLMTLTGRLRDEPMKVQYVGKTMEPHVRLGGLRHEHLTRIAHQTAEDSDTFLMVNVFKATVHAPASGFVFLSTNAMTNEIDVDREADVIECAFVCYFASRYQSDGEGIEHGTLKNRLRDMLRKRNIQEIVFDLELAVDLQSDRLYSDAVEISRRHIFRCSLREGRPLLERLPEDFDALQWSMARSGE